VDVLVLAAAGLDRLDRRREAGGALAGEVFVPAPGQGTIAVQARAGSEAGDVAAAVGHARTMAWLQAERAVVRSLSATCHTPVGIHADSVTVRGFAGLPDGSQWLVDEVAVEDEDVVAAGEELARRMLAAGAAELLRDAEAMAAR
jgi:hydroxymethylbilane synthase